MNRRPIPVLIAVALALAAVTLSGCTGTSPTPAPSAPLTTTGTTAPGSVLPVTSNPIANTSTTPGLSITYAAVEDNVDPATKAPIDDRLQLTLKNDTASDLTHVEVYYTMLDTKTQATESYYSDLSDLVLPAGKETTVYFDNTGQPGHYPENKFSLYRSSANEVTFTIEVSADGVKPATATATKAVGTGEVPGE